MQNPKVSVIIPIYNAEKYIEECLESVINQTLKEFEIICIDDGSTDRSLEIISKYKQKDKRIIVLQQKNSGSGIARNAGIKKSNGKYISFLDADDNYPSTKVLEILVDSCEKYNMSIAGGGISLRKYNEIIPAIKRGLNNFFAKEGIINYNDVQFDYGYQRYIFSRELLIKNNIFFPSYIRFQDPPFLVKAMICAQNFYALREETYCYRWGHQNINWNFKRTNDMVSGIIDVLNLSIKYNLINLFNVCINRIDKEYYNIINKSLNEGNVYLINLLMEICLLVNKNIEFVKDKNILIYDQYITKALFDRIFDKNNKIKLVKISGKNDKGNNIYNLKKFLILPFKIIRQIKSKKDNIMNFII